jgi:hypothetical protein
MARSLGALNLPVTAMEEGQAAFGKITEAVRQQLTERGFPVRARPAGYTGALPSDLIRISDDELGRLLGDIETYMGWVEEELAMLRTAKLASEENRSFVEARVRVELRAMALGGGVTKLTSDEAKDHMLTDPRVVDAAKNALFYDALHGEVKAVFESAARAWSTVSRRITQRGQDVDRMKRNPGAANSGAFSGYLAPRGSRQ